ncbi:MAG: DNA repair protein RecN, partial [Gammaproteobacteria bacterium]|nr:DNA repair protein RecN [Gammaproteobacteria bacterium]
QVSDTDSDSLSQHGTDRIDFMVSANPGQPLQDLRKVASGGELSRISLAIALASSSDQQMPTLVFDEVDSGIGGATAETVGRYLRTLGQEAQVLCVTHLPQVAAQAHHHLQVAKRIEDGQTRTILNVLDEKATIEEIARMLGGAKVTKKSRQHAQEMLDSAV